MKQMIIEEIEQLGKQMHQLAEEYEASCKMGDGFEVHVVIGKLHALIPPLRAMGKKCHGMNQPDIREGEHGT